MTLDVGIFFLVTSLLILTGIFRSKKTLDERSYLVTEGNTGLFTLVATLVMTEFNTSTLIAFSAMGYMAKGWALSLPFVFLVGLLFYSLTVAKKWKEYNALSNAQFFYDKFGPLVGSVASICLLFAMTGFSAVYVKSMTVIFSPIVPTLSPWILSALLVFATLIISWRGGLQAIMRADILSMCLIALFLPLTCYYSWGQASSVTFKEGIETLPFSFVLAITILTMFTYILAPWYGQKIVAAKNPKTAKKAVFFAAIIVFLLYGCACLATALLTDPLVNPEEALTHIITNKMPHGLRGLGFSLLFAAGATTLAGVWSAMASMVVGDWLKLKGTYQRGALLTLGFATVSFFLANVLIDQIFQKLILANIPVFALSFALLAGFYWKGVTQTGAIISITVGITWGLFTYLYYGEEGLYQWYWAVLGLPLIFGSGYIASLATKKKTTLLQH